jgi:hypothetical protein
MASDHLDDDTYIYFLPIRAYKRRTTPCRACESTTPSNSSRNQDHLFNWWLTGATNIDVVHCCFD